MKWWWCQLQFFATAQPIISVSCIRLKILVQLSAPSKVCSGDGWHVVEGWVLLSAERKSPLLSKWKGPGSLSLMVWRHYWEHKAVPWIPMGGCWVLEGTQPPADKHCQLAEGPYSSAMCSHLINRTHSLHQVQANTKPFPWALGFLLISLSMSIKKALLWC